MRFVHDGGFLSRLIRSCIRSDLFCRSVKGPEGDEHRKRWDLKVELLFLGGGDSLERREALRRGWQLGS